MKKFKFTLEAVLKYKRTIEKTQKAALAEVRMRLSALENEREKLRMSVKSAHETLNAAVESGGGIIDAMRVHGAYVTRLKAEDKELVRRIVVVEAEKDLREAELIATMRELKGYDKLYDEQYLAYLKEVQAEEEKEISDIVSRDAAVGV
ncbi:MAG: hypothetical protein LBS90_06940 [Oscillospiraceae bacterium]|jgi:flagellar export protein FliJ|nr:hypothetical protein [Oscillospiraceae bacterium]